MAIYTSDSEKDIKQRQNLTPFSFKMYLAKGLKVHGIHRLYLKSKKNEINLL